MTCSASDFGRDHGLMHEVVVTGRGVGWGREEWSKFAHDATMMRRVGFVLNGTAVIAPADGYIDCDADPFVPKGMLLHRHVKHGMYKGGLQLFRSTLQQPGLKVKSEDVWREVVDLPVANANVLDYWLKNWREISKEWKGKRIFFWGTIYRIVSGQQYVRYLEWEDDKRKWVSYMLEINNWHSNLTDLSDNDLSALYVE